MTMKSIPIVVGFAVITASQFVLGVWMMVLSALKGGKTLALGSKNRPHSTRVPAISFL